MFSISLTSTRPKRSFLPPYALSLGNWFFFGNPTIPLLPLLLRIPNINFFGHASYEPYKMEKMGEYGSFFPTTLAVKSSFNVDPPLCAMIHHRIITFHFCYIRSTPKSTSPCYLYYSTTCNLTSIIYYKFLTLWPCHYVVCTIGFLLQGSGDLKVFGHTPFSSPSNQDRIRAIIWCLSSRSSGKFLNFFPFHRP